MYAMKQKLSEEHFGFWIPRKHCLREIMVSVASDNFQLYSFPCHIVSLLILCCMPFLLSITSLS